MNINTLLVLTIGTGSLLDKETLKVPALKAYEEM